MDGQAMMEWIGANGEVAVAIVSALVAFVSAVSARHSIRRLLRLREESLRQSVDSGSLAWGAEAIDAMSEASALALSTHLDLNTMRARRLDVARRLSALADRGRLFFPNVEADGHGAEKEGAYQGKRPPVLDALIYAYHETLRLGDGPVRGDDSARFITECRRLLVSELPAHLDPHRIEEVVGRYNGQAEALREDALDRAGRLGVILDVRRPGVLTEAADGGWMDRVGAEERRELLHAYQVRGDAA